jgi:hypothetical protein
MRKALGAILFVATLLTALPSRAQNPNYDAGPVWRVTYYHLKPGQGEAFWRDFREVKKEGMITDYKVWTNATGAGAVGKIPPSPGCVGRRFGAAGAGKAQGGWSGIRRGRWGGRYPGFRG